MDINYLNISIH